MRLIEIIVLIPDRRTQTTITSKSLLVHFVHEGAPIRSCSSNCARNKSAHLPVFTLEHVPALCSFIRVGLNKSSLASYQWPVDQ
jgi:hypothetical protein